MHIISQVLVVAAVAVTAVGSAAAANESSPSQQDADGSAVSARPLQRGQASWYGSFHEGRRTANGETFRSAAMTAAHRTLPFGTRVRVTREGTGRSVVVRINDRGPFVKGRIIDLSRAAAQAIGIAGVATVSLTKL
jgi:peptidoglycan lytic transglycosylase